MVFYKKYFIYFSLLCIISFPIFYYYALLLGEKSSHFTNKNGLNSMVDEDDLNLLTFTSLKYKNNTMLNKKKNSSPYYVTSHLTKNTIYKRFNITAPKHKKRVGIVVIIQSAPREFERRQSVRNTWLQDCVSTENVRNCE